MGKGNKNRNAFYFFMQDFRNQHGRNFRSMAEVATAAGPHWQKLSSQQRHKYEEMARQNKENQQKQTSVGESIDLLLQEEKEKRDREISMKQEIDNIIKKGVNTKTITDYYFYLMHINEFCYWEKENRFFPAEIALGKFNLRNGIIKEDVYSSLVQPGPLPLGYSAIAKLKSEETHQIQHMDSDNNMEEVLMSLINKLLEDTESDTFPPIYVSDKDMFLVENVLTYMSEVYGQANIFTIYSLQYLLYSLKNNISPTGAKVWPTISVSKLQLEKDIYDFCSGIACGYHENSEIPVYCSRSQIIRWAYIVCDNCIGDLNIPVIKGRHVPMNALTDQHDVATASGVSLKSARSYASSIASSSRSVCQSDAASETSTVIDESEVTSYHGFDSDSQTADDEIVWRRPRHTARYKTPLNMSQASDSSQLSQSSSISEHVPARRPLSQSSANPGISRPNNVLRGRGRGRGRGFLQTRPPM